MLKGIELSGYNTRLKYIYMYVCVFGCVRAPVSIHVCIYIYIYIYISIKMGKRVTYPETPAENYILHFHKETNVTFSLKYKSECKF